jgi:hypothetical protein
VSYCFTVLLDRIPTDDEIEAGMRTPTGVSGLDEDPPSATMSVAVDEVSSWTEAFAEGVTEVEELGVRVIGFAHDAERAFVDEGDLALRFSLSERYVLELAADVVGPGGFPPRVEDSHGNSLAYWRWGPVREWFRKHFGSDMADRFDREITAANCTISRQPIPANPPKPSKPYPPSRQ